MTEEPRSYFLASLSTEQKIIRMSGGIYGQYQTPVYRSIPDLLETPREELSFREKHRIRCDKCRSYSRSIKPIRKV